jgi:serine protease
LDLVAPSGNGNGAGDVVTMDLMDSRGANSGNYLSTFGGTSAAAPQVAGIAALMLSVNPNLTEAQIRTMLQQSATDMGSTGFDNNFGFGRANAQKALLAAFGTINGPSLICSGGQYTLANQPPGSSFTWSTSNPSGLSISSSGFATRQNSFNGQVTIVATVNSGCDTVNVTLSVWVGTPHITNQRVDGGSYFAGMQICSGNHWLSVTPIGGNASVAVLDSTFRDPSFYWHQYIGFYVSDKCE